MTAIGAGSLSERVNGSELGIPKFWKNGLWGHFPPRSEAMRDDELPIDRARLDRVRTCQEACLAIVQGAGIALPAMYGLGFQNNNCIPCPKATSPNYWAAMRLHFPEQFSRMAKLSRELGARLARVNDERVFIDEIPADWPTLNPIAPACDFLCHLAEQDLAA
jgi:hypothetical protein